MIKGSDLFVAALQNEGVERIFGVPGEENLDTVESLRTSGIELVVTRHEQSAAFMAATHGRLTGQPGVCISTLGPGRVEPRDRSGLRAPGRDADDSDHRAEGDQEQPAGALPDRRHGGHDETADQVLPPDCQHVEHSRRSCVRPFGWPPRNGRVRCTWSCPKISRASWDPRCRWFLRIPSSCPSLPQSRWIGPPR